MADKYLMEITPTLFRITDLTTSKYILDNKAWKYLFFDASGDIIFPCSPTVSGTNYNLTYRFDDIERVISNPVTGNSTPTSFDVFHAYFKVLNASAETSTFTTIQASNVELPSITSGEPTTSYSDGGDGGGSY